MGAKKLILCDTNILIHLFHKDAKVSEEMDIIDFNNLAISVITVAEIYYGMRQGESRKTKEVLRAFTIIHLSKEISKKFIELMADRSKRRMQLPDALIAATAIVSNAQLFTLNRQDFDFVSGIELYNPHKKIT